jgi:uncharacterized membrane protein YjgN (DUF898 family)
MGRANITKDDNFVSGSGAVHAVTLFAKEAQLYDDLPYEERVKRYTLEELEDVAAHMDREKYPERYEVLLSELALRAGPAPEGGPEEPFSPYTPGERVIPPDSTPLPFDFTGATGEYFRIWIVNIALTVITLGIYSAWAKVRKNRYIYGSTLLQEAPFEYLADPVKILIGRIIVVALFAVFMFVSYFALPLMFVLWPIWAFLYPWIVIRALSFKARNSAYRNIRFDFKATYRNALGVYVGFAILTSLTLGLLYPYYEFRKKQFVIENAGFGRTAMNFIATPGQFYAVYISALFLAIIGGIFAVLVLFPLIQIFYPESAEAAVHPFFAFLPTIIIYAFVYLPVYVYIRTRITNIFWSHTFIGNSLLECDLQISRMVWLYLSNAVAIIFSLGLLIPWATIRMNRYKIGRLTLHAVEDIESFTAGEQQKIGAAGEEISEFFAFDIGL